MRPTSLARAGHLAPLSAALLLGATPLLAQAADPDSGCTYERCALRFEEPEVLVGAPYGPRAVVARFGPFRAPDLRDRVARSDSARHYAALVVGHHRRATIGNVVGVALAATGLVVALGAEEGDLTPVPTVLGLAAAGSAASWYGAWELRQARRMLGRTIWWYNRELPREGEQVGR